MVRRTLDEGKNSEPLSDNIVTRDLRLVLSFIGADKMKLSYSYTHLVLAEGGARVSLSREVTDRPEREREEGGSKIHETMFAGVNRIAAS